MWLGIHKPCGNSNMIGSPVTGSSYAEQAVQIGTCWIGMNLLENAVTSQVCPVKYIGVKFLPKQCVSAWLSISIVDTKSVIDVTFEGNIETLVELIRLVVLITDVFDFLYAVRPKEFPASFVWAEWKFVGVPVWVCVPVISETSSLTVLPWDIAETDRCGRSPTCVLLGRFDSRSFRTANCRASHSVGG